MFHSPCIILFLVLLMIIPHILPTFITSLVSTLFHFLKTFSTTDFIIFHLLTIDRLYLFKYLFLSFYQYTNQYKNPETTNQNINIYNMYHIKIYTMNSDIKNEQATCPILKLKNSQINKNVSYDLPIIRFIYSTLKTIPL